MFTNNPMSDLAERRSKSYHLEALYIFYLRILQRHHKQLTLPKVWDSIEEGLHMYPFSPEIFNIMVDIGNTYATPNKLRWSFDELFNRYNLSLLTFLPTFMKCAFELAFINL